MSAKALDALALPVISRRAQQEYLLLDNGGRTIGHFLFASELLRTMRGDQVAGICLAVNVHDQLVDALRELAELKAIKTECGDFRCSQPDANTSYWRKVHDYDRRQPLAWAKAGELLKSLGVEIAA